MKRGILMMLVMTVALAACVTFLYIKAAPAAHNLTGPVWYLDTSGVTDLTSNTVRIRMIVWMDCSTAGHDFVLKDQSGVTVFADTSGQAGVPHFYPGLDITTDGLVLDKLESGYLLIDVQPKSY